jgi:7-carboxy-7-deazaguanine synthase
MTAVRTRLATVPVIEVFGPTVQGEGPDAGRPCYFVRLGGCDYRCSWCDSMYAVDPAEVRAHSERLTATEITGRLADLDGEAPIVVISGGNPALFDLTALVAELQSIGYRVSVETQGSRWKDWLNTVNRLVVSPKPPSSGMATPAHELETATFMLRAHSPVMKIVVFDAEDFEWAMRMHERYPAAPLYLSAGTPQPTWPDGVQPSPAQVNDAEGGMLRMVLDNYRMLCERVARDPRAREATVLPQLHVLAWGAARGV